MPLSFFILEEQTKMFTCNTCNFSTPDPNILRQHYTSDWHSRVFEILENTMLSYMAPILSFEKMVFRKSPERFRSFHRKKVSPQKILATTGIPTVKWQKNRFFEMVEKIVLKPSPSFSAPPIWYISDLHPKFRRFFKKKFFNFHDTPPCCKNEFQKTQFLVRGYFFSTEWPESFGRLSKNHFFKR